MIPRKTNTPFLPVSPSEIAKDVKRCYELGISMVHIHSRNEEGDPTWQPERFNEIISEIKSYAPELIIIVTTSGRDWSDLEKRAAVLGIDGECKPDMASLTLGSMNFPKQASVNPPQVIQSMAQMMTERGIMPELEAFEIGMINYADFLIRKEIVKPPFYFNLLLGSLNTCHLNALNIGTMIASLPPRSTWSLAGIGRYQLAANTIGIALGGHVRIGLEDNTIYDFLN
ncbi:MAG: 3-keto-5-aminohexanoate cleavage protein, partial [Bacteroidia bacterium]|nr:3-keto-5-aminohexanoate cleavage protein [Bacteroidia bacterium]